MVILQKVCGYGCRIDVRISVFGDSAGAFWGQAGVWASETAQSVLTIALDQLLQIGRE